LAKAQEIEITAEEPYALAGARVVRVRTHELFDHAEGVLDTSDIERVHDMRVASRRLRAVLEIFAPCFPPDEYRDVLNDVKRLADALGERRDPDVHIAAMEEFAAAVDQSRKPGVMRLVEMQRARQAAGNEVLAGALNTAQESDLEARLLELADLAEEQLEDEGVAT
jgi:CHAD domain-containing protein